MDPASRLAAAHEAWNVAAYCPLLQAMPIGGVASSQGHAGTLPQPTLSSRLARFLANQVRLEQLMESIAAVLRQGLAAYEGQPKQADADQ